MSFPPRTRMVNPRLGIYFGIFTSAFVCLAVLSLVLESLGLPLPAMHALMAYGPLVLVAVIGVGCYTTDHRDYFAAGRRVPDVYSGLGLAMTALGATGLLGITGTFFLAGFDALCLVIGGLAGFVVMAILLAPFYRKFGAYTVPSYLGRRLDSSVVRLASAAMLAVPMVLIIAAELLTGVYALGRITDVGPGVSLALLSLTLLVTLVAGGMRSSMWTTTAQSIACILAIVVPAMVAALILTNLPLPQLSYGPLTRLVGRGEASLGLPIVLPPALAFDIPGPELQPIAKRFADAMGSVGPAAFVLAILTTMAGIASAPWLLPRVAVAPGVYEARKSLGWATVLFGFVMLTLAPIALYMRAFLIDILTGPGGVKIPEWFNELVGLGAAGLAVDENGRQLTDFLFARDGILLGLPVAARMPAAAVELISAGVVAVALAAAGASALALGNILAEDVANGLSSEPAPDRARLVVARGGLVVAIGLGAAIALSAPADPLGLLLWALALSGSVAFPVLLLSIWWKRLNAYGALAGMLTGFTVALLVIFAGENGLSGIDGGLAGALGIPAAVAAAIVVTLITPAPSRHVYELVRDIRVPGGEIIYDREMLALRRKKRHG